MAQHPPARKPAWRTQVQQWLASVRNHQAAHRRMDVVTAARQNQHSFPRSWLVVIVGQLFKGIAKWIVKTTLQDAASGLGIDLSQAELDVIAELGLDALLAA